MSRQPMLITRRSFLEQLNLAAGGLALGFAGFLAYAAWAGAPALAWMPFTFMAKPWLGFNTVVCLIIARAMLKKEDA